MPRRAFIAVIMKVSGNVNADMSIGNRIPLKKILTWNQEVRAFVSARCVRRCIRERLYEKVYKKGLSIDPLCLDEAKQQLVDVGDPVKYIDDDLFGYFVPAEVPSKRSSPIKISHLIALRHTEVKPEFAARFPRDFVKKPDDACPAKSKGEVAEWPVPFEVEVAEWLGRLNVIVSDRVGCFDVRELRKDREYRDKIAELVRQGRLEERDGMYCLKEGERVERLRAFLEVLLWEGWQFPRAAQSPSVPEFYYSVVALTERFVPMFGYVDVDNEGKLSWGDICKLMRLYGSLIDELLVLDYRNAKYWVFVNKGGSLVEEAESEESKDAKKSYPPENWRELEDKAIGDLIKKVCDYVIFGQRKGGE